MVGVVQFFLNKNTCDYSVPKEKISFEDSTEKKSVWGIQSSIESAEVKMLLADLSQDSLPEFVLLVKIKDCPTYCCHLLLSEEDNPEALIAVSSDKIWLPCNTFLQSMFLTGMEQLRDVSSGWKKLETYKEEYSSLLSFINFVQNYFEGEET